MPKRYFFIGSEWLYYKIYCGPKTADTILTDVIKPLTEFFTEKNFIDKWFFIRYNDDDGFHLRIRFHIKTIGGLTDIVSLLNQKLEPFIENLLIWKIVTDTYQREIERYGENTIELAEDLFCNDSVLTVGLLSLIEGDEGEIVRWGVGLRSIDEFINDFNYSLEEKFTLLTFMKDSFASEFNMNSYLKTQLSNKYRKERNFITNILNSENDSKSELKPIFNLIQERSAKNKVIIDKILKIKNENKLEKPLNEFMWSYLHMLNNRLFKSKQRIHELVMYFLLHQHYRSKLARMGIKVK